MIPMLSAVSALPLAPVDGPELAVVLEPELTALVHAARIGEDAARPIPIPESLRIWRRSI